MLFKDLVNRLEKDVFIWFFLVKCLLLIFCVFGFDNDFSYSKIGCFIGKEYLVFGRLVVVELNYN